MNIPELKWITENRNVLSNDDYKMLESLDLFSQYDSNRMLEQSYPDMVQMLGLINYIYEKHNR